MNDKYIVYLHDLSEGVRALSRTAKITNIYPFLSCVGVEAACAESIIAYDFVKSIAEIARVSVCGEAEEIFAGDIRVAIGADNIVSGGEGVTVAVIDTGLSSHIDFFLPPRITEFVDIINDMRIPYDDNGHGTAVASVLAGSGLMSEGKYRGIAPDVRLVPIKAINSNGEGSTLEILQAMQWLYNNHRKYDIRVACMSFGSQPVGKNDPLALGAAALWEQGIVVVASSGNAGPQSGTVMSPGISPYIITVGGANTEGGEIGIADFSSRGPVGEYNKPDLIAPAVNVACCGTNEDYVIVSGTSVSTPMVAGAVALILSKHPSYTPDKVKEILLKTASPIDGCPINGCGKGMLNIRRIMELL